MGLGNVIIGVKITKMYDRLVLSWPYYVEKKSKKFNKIDYSVTRVSLDIGFHLSKKIEEEVFLRKNTQVCELLNISSEFFKTKYYLHGK